MNIYAVVEGLLMYAQEHLLLDEFDVIYSRNQIIEELRLNNYEEYEISMEEIEKLANPFNLLNQIDTYAVENKIIGESDRDSFDKKIMNFLIKRPSEIADMFTALLSSNPSKAFSWAYDYSVKSGYIRSRNILKQWEAKGTKGKIEIAISELPDISGDEKPKYPKCNFCVENEGYRSRKLQRSVPLELGGESYVWQFSETPYVQGLGSVINVNHTPRRAGKQLIERLFDFADLNSGYLIASRDCASAQKHEYFKGASRLFPFHKAPDLRKLKSAEYPYIDITEVDWYMNALRFVCSNREKTVEFTDKFISAYKNESDSYDVTISVRRLESKYCVEILLEDKKCLVSPDNTNLKQGNPDLPALLGLFVLPSEIEEDMKQIDSFLTKEVKYNESKLAPNLERHKKMIAKLLKEIGSTKISKVEAQIDIKEEINNICEASLGDVRVFGKTETGEKAFFEFLDRVGIRIYGKTANA